MLWAAMPEAAVNKHRDALAYECDVRAYSKVRAIDPVVLAKTEPSPKQRAPKRPLGSCVRATV
jgi:hypothetical protein